MERFPYLDSMFEILDRCVVFHPRAGRITDTSLFSELSGHRLKKLSMNRIKGKFRLKIMVCNSHIKKKVKFKANYWQIKQSNI